MVILGCNSKRNEEILLSLEDDSIEEAPQQQVIIKKNNNDHFYHLLLYNRVIVLEVCIVIATILTSLNLIKKECKYKKDYLVEECKS